MRKLLYIVMIFIGVSACTSRQESKPYDWDDDLHQRLLADFCLTESQVKDYIRKYIPDVTDEQMRQWEESKALECRVIDGEKRYFRNAGPNLFRIDSACCAVKMEKEGTSLSTSEQVNKEHLPEVMAAVRKEKTPVVQPKRMRVTYTLTMDSNAVPAGKMIRCWLPYPRTDQPRQLNVKLLHVSEPRYTLSPPSCRHSTLYMEKQAIPGEPTVFSETFEYTSCAEWHPLKPGNILPYDTAGALYKEYTAERETHIRFTPRIKELAANLTVGETNPLLKAQRIFRWINDHFPWASAREYSTIENSPEYVLDNRHGDCGQVSLLFITLCRCSGIPARFQSGFMMHPRAWNLHDWAEVYFEGAGWVPVDQSFGIPTFADNPEEKMFFMGGIDPWRMIVNSDYSMPLVPEKKYPRSETVDFQRGEVEWEGANTKLTVGASATPHAEILEAAKPILAEKGIDLEIVIFDDYVQPNLQLEAGDLDANYFQHIPYLENFNAENGTHLVSAGAVHYEPMGLYVNPAKSIALDSIPDGATIAIPNDTTNESRALGLLEFNGLIKLDTEAGQTATVLDIAENPHKFDFVEVEAAQVPRTLADVDLGVINSNYALQAGVDVVGTPIAYESTEVAYPNIIAVREGDDREELKTLVEALQSDEIVNFINETYKGAVVPTK